VSSAKTAEPVVMSIRLRIRVGPRNHVLDGSDLSWEGAIIRRERGGRCKLVNCSYSLP